MRSRCRLLDRPAGGFSRAAPGGRCSTRDGVALIMVLGLLSVLSLLIFAFAKSMRDERLAARGFADRARAQDLVDVALIRAVEDIDQGMRGYCYPHWAAASGDAMASGGSANCTNLLQGLALEAIPAAIREAARLAAPLCRWNNIASYGMARRGRIAYLVANTSGLLDAHEVGGTNRLWSTSVRELNLSELPDISGEATFFGDRDRDRRYETPAELARLNAGVETVSNLFVYSYDPGRDVYFTRSEDLGTRDIELLPKFGVNAITNYTSYEGIGFRTNVWAPLTNLLARAGLPPESTAWNLINFVDNDRIPQGGTNFSYRLARGGEAVPLINEIVLEESRMPLPTDYQYQFDVEVWFPFAPAEVRPADQFKLSLGVFDRNWYEQPGAAPSEQTIMDQRRMDWSATTDIDSMAYGGPSEFRTFESPPIAFPPVTVWVTAGAAEGPVVLCPPIGVYVYDSVKVVVIDGVPTQVKGDPTAVTNYLWFLSRVTKSADIVDEAMGYDPGDEVLGQTNRWALKKFSEPVGYSVDDPRMNGQVRYWQAHEYPWNDASKATLGATNFCCRPWANDGQGVPIVHADRALRSIGEVGYVYCSDEDADPPVGWQSIDLTSADGGAALPDWMTVRAHNVPARGLVHISTLQQEVLRTLFVNTSIGCTNTAFSNRRLLTPGEEDLLVASISPAGLNFRDVLTDMGDASSPYRTWSPDGANACGDFKEDAVRNILEMITFRQNLFTLILAAQVVAGDDDETATVLAEQRAVAIVFRDSYTGRYFVRSLRTLSD